MHKTTFDQLVRKWERCQERIDEAIAPVFGMLKDKS
jgi:hypothetical protein